VNAISKGRVHAYDRDTTRDLNAQVLIHHQQASCAALAVILETAAAGLAKLDFPLGYPRTGHDQDTALDLLRDLMPTQTEAEMAIETEVRDAEARAMTHANRNDVMRGM
jgi:hypothetical protein